jgi:hypothetical protein
MTRSMADLFAPATLEALFPADLADRFFDALYGDADEGAYDIRLHFANGDDRRLTFEFHLHQRPGKCLVCSLTYGLPKVFPRHPILDLKGLVARIDDLLEDGLACKKWFLGSTREVSPTLHAIPLTIQLERDGHP